MSEEVWFTADTHFDHTGALRFRPTFQTVGEMNGRIISNWRAVIKPGDRVYHLGDFGFFGKGRMETIRHQLPGQIHLILGNHDKLNAHEKSMFASVSDIKYIKVKEQKIFLCHYAMRTWRGSHRGSWALYGHSHGNLAELDTLFAFDVGVDCNNYMPVHFDAIRERMKGKTFVAVDHHTAMDDGDEQTEANL